jgi:hypothetical protein
MKLLKIYMSPQEALNVAYDHLWNQNCRSTQDGGHACSYRGQNGTKCAFGIFIPDEDYNEEFEGCSVHTLAKERKVKFIGLANENFYQKLQTIHDSYHGEYAKTLSFRQHLNNTFPEMAFLFSLHFVPRSID